MPKAGKSSQKFVIHTSESGAGKQDARVLVSALKKRNGASDRAVAGINRELDAIDAAYRTQLAKLIGSEGAAELDKIRNGRGNLTRSQRQRKSLGVLKKHGVLPAEILELRRPYLRKVSELLTPVSDFFPVRPPHVDPCKGAPVIYAAPFNGYYWTYRWDSPPYSTAPLVGPYIDEASGSLGSSVKVNLSGADNADSRYAEILTAFYVWHTPQATGPLEISVSIEFPQEGSRFWGKITDEWGRSDCVRAQYIKVLLGATDSQNVNQSDTALLLTESLSRYTDGYSHSWDHRFPTANEIRTYRLKTAATFSQGSSVLIEAGIQHASLFRTNDMSVSNNGSLNAHLVEIEVRSCAAPPIPRRRRRKQRP